MRQLGIPCIPCKYNLTLREWPLDDTAATPPGMAHSCGSCTFRNNKCSRVEKEVESI